MKKKLLIIVATVIVIISLAIVLLLVNKKLEIPELEAGDISNVYYDILGENKSMNLDIEEFLGYYNQIYDIREVTGGTTPDSRIVIELKDGSDISIYSSGDQFEVNFYDSEGKLTQYWGKQQEIYNMLIYGFYGLN